MELPSATICRVDLGRVSGEEKKKILAILRMRDIAIVGISPKEDRPSYDVAKYLKENGYNIIPVRPATKEILGKKCYKSLEEAREPIEVVDVFRRSEYCVEIARHAVKIGAKALWLQEGVYSEEAKIIAENAGLVVIMDRCLKKAHREFKDEL